MDDQIIGHDAILSFFSAVIGSGRLGHAYCLVGSEHVGKGAIARTVAAQILGTIVSKLDTHPDWMWLERSIDQKTEKMRRDIDVDDIESLRSFASRRPYLGGKKCLVINGAEHLNAHSANALLKTLEEPSGQTVFFLLTTDDDQLPATIRSRCQMIRVGHVGADTIMQALVGRGCDAEVATRAVNMAHGLPGLARVWVEQPEVFADYQAERQTFFHLFGVSFADKCTAIEPYFKETDDHTASRERWQSRLREWQLALRDARSEKTAPVLPDDRFIRIMDQIEETIGFLAENAHPRLAIEHILLSIP